MTQDNWHYGDSSTNTLTTFLFILLLTVAIVGIVLATVAVSRHHSRNPGNNTLQHETALELLHKRYARGEIDKKVFEEKRRDLTE